MANPLKGETEFELEGRHYMLRFTSNELCALEDVLQRGALSVLADMGKPETFRISAVRAFLWAGLREHHPEVTLKQAGQMIDKLGGVMPGLALVQKAIGRAYGEDGEGQASASANSPLESRANGSGIGANS